METDFYNVLENCRYRLMECLFYINEYSQENNLALDRYDLEDKNHDLLIILSDFGQLAEKIEMLKQAYPREENH